MANALQSEPDRLKVILLELELLSREMQYVLNNHYVQDPKVHGMFKGVSETVYRLRNDSTFNHDQVKYVCRFFGRFLQGGALLTDTARKMLSSAPWRGYER